MKVAAGFIVVALAVGQNCVAEERIVHANVVEVVPLTQASDGCGSSRPAVRPGAAGLAAILEWDLQTQCRPAITRYRVYYTWDDRTYSTVSRKRPDATLPILLTVD